MHPIVPLSLALFLASPVAAQAWERQVLDLHNRERTSWRVPPLGWDNGLAASADRWAAEMTRTGRWEHSPRSWRAGQGENLWMGTAGAYTVPEMVGGWIGERRWFRPGVFPNVSTTRRWSDVAHYTQMIARGTQRVGCAIRSSRRWTYLVCRYSPAGNVMGRPVP